MQLQHWVRCEEMHRGLLERTKRRMLIFRNAQRSTRENQEETVEIQKCTEVYQREPRGDCLDSEMHRGLQYLQTDTEMLSQN
ncbi:hypothetical protein AOXY_G23383 [Acipenser oxyrinchus oxyrinchus]|uniref:Uncharacterized protein n=1 Tax=Acipenser oxyrinchus oxyrinchus TaxID=40147 RepID=A0AAD8CXR1_ACIOX|nr:hypothetical protein AOXY_G23383 [Acipenser oxyrinchus oxyrinchus]